MKFSQACLFLLVLGSISSCRSNRNCSDEVVCGTVHKYGVCLEPEDWIDRGKHGQMISMRKDGVAINRCYDSGILHGETTYTFPHREVIQKKEIYEQGNLTQEITHYPSGFPQKQAIYETPSRQMVTTWFENGAPHCHEVIENGNILRGEYYNHDQQVESRVEDGNGLRMMRDAHGQLQSQDTIQNQQMTLRTTYHPNGMPATLTPYVDGKVHGERRTYLPGGEPGTIETWSEDAQHGITHEYESGDRRGEIPFVNGNRHGIERRYRDDGQTVAQETTWVNGKRHGPENSYIGNRVTTDWYFQDRKVPNKATFDMLQNQ